MNVNKVLLDESPLVVQPTLAVYFGLEAAIILQQFHYWILNREKFGVERHFIDGKWWIWNSYDEWSDDAFPFLSARTIQRIVLDLEKKGILISCQMRLKYGDATKYYSIDYQKLDELIEIRRIEVEAERAEKERRKAEKKNGVSPGGSANGSAERVNDAEKLIDLAFGGDGREIKNPGAYRALVSGVVENDKNRASGKVDVSDFPEDVREVVRAFCETWKISPPVRRRGKGGDFALWINDARALRKAISDNGGEVVRISEIVAAVRSDWERKTTDAGGIPPYTVSRPGAIIKTTISKLSALRIGAGGVPVSVYTIPDTETIESQRERIRLGRERAGFVEAGIGAAN